MVEYTLVLELGGSNASPIGDIQGWEDKHPELAIRSPNTDRSQAKQFSSGSYRDDFTLPATFKGGPQIDLDGATINGTWQTVNLRGVASDAVRVATFHNPSATLQTNKGYARSWPGTYSVAPTASEALPNTGREFATNFLVQPGRSIGTGTTITAEAAQVLTTGADHGLVVNDIVVFKNGTNLQLTHNGPYKVTATATTDKIAIADWPSLAAVPTMTFVAGATVHKVNNTASPFKITRKRTGSTHTYAPTGLGQTDGGRLVVDPPFTPAPADNEEFTVDMQLQSAPADANDPLVFDACLGGFVNNTPLLTATSTLRTSTSSSYRLLYSPKQPLRQGRGINVENQNANSFPTAATVILTSTSTTVTALPTAGNYTAYISVGDAIFLGNAGSFPSSIFTADTVPYYVTAITTTTITLAGSYGGTPISVATTSTPWAMTILPAGENRYLTRQPVALVPAAHTATQAEADLLTVAVEQEFAVGEKVRVSYASGVGPTNLLAGNYYVKTIASSGGVEKLGLSTGPDTSALTFTWGGQSPIVERLDAYATWFMSAERDGADSTTSIHSTATVTWTERQRFAGSLTGLRLRCTSGANVGQWKHGTHVSYDSTNDLCQAHFDGDWASTPAKDDVFVIEPTPVKAEDRPYEKFCQLLPWSPFEGRARGSREAGLSTVTIPHGNTTTSLQAVGMSAPDRSSVKFYSTGTLPNGLTPGKTYYVSKAYGTTCEIATSYGGYTTQTAAAGDGTHYAEVVDNDNGLNPHPPGFNYPSQFSVPRRYMPFDGYTQGSFYGEQTSQQSAGISAGVQLAFDLHSHTGRRSLYVPLAFEKTSIGHREVHADGTGTTFGWSDLNQQLSWAPGESNGCFARLLGVLDGVKLALTEEGSTISDVVVHFNQGEVDAETEYLSTTYRKNLKQLKAAVRQALFDRGLTPGKVKHVKWLQATIPTDVPPAADQDDKTRWPYAATINTAIEAEAAVDAYSRSLVGTDLESHADRTAFSGNTAADQEHYHGAQMDLLGQRAFAAFKSMERSGKSEIDICNLALANLGEQARVTSIEPSDGSREADLCAQFFSLARDQMLEKHAWDFALRSVKPTVQATSPRVDYKYAYDYPEDVASVLTVVRSDVDYNYKTMGSTGQQPYSVELDANGNRMLLTDQKDALLLYVAKVEDATMWSSLFIRALSWQLASHLAGPVMKGEEGMKAVQMCEAMAERTLRQATKHDGDHKRDVDINDHVPTWQRHRSNRGFSI